MLIFFDEQPDVQVVKHPRNVAPHFLIERDGGAMKPGAHRIERVYRFLGHHPELLELAADDYRQTGTLQESRSLMRYVLGHYLGGQELHTRQLLREMQQL